MRELFWAERTTAEKHLSESHGDFDDMAEETKERYRTAQVILDRLRASKDLWTDLFQCLPIAKAFFGLECEQQLDLLWQLHGRLLLAANEYAKIDPATDHARSERYFDEIIGTFDDNDKFENELLGIVLFLEQMLLPQVVDAATPQRSAVGQNSDSA